MFDALPLPEPFQDRGFLIRSIWRYQQAYGFADYLTCLIAEYSFSSLIPASDDAVKILGKDRILRSFYDGRQLCEADLCFASGVRFRRAKARRQN